MSFADPILATRPLPDDVDVHAEWGEELREDGTPRDRYLLRWTRKPGLTPSRPGALVLGGLNPSGGGIDVADATLLRVWSIAGRLGFDEFAMLNLFPLRARDPEALLTGTGDRQANLRWWLSEIRDAQERGRLVVLACGGPYSPAALQVLVEEQMAAFVRIARAVRAPLHALAVTKDGYPRHPLYLPNTATPAPWFPPGRTEITAQRYTGCTPAIVEILALGGYCPVTASGRVGGLPFALHARNDRICLKVARAGRDAWDVTPADALLWVAATFHGAVHELSHIDHQEAARWARDVLLGWAAGMRSNKLRELVERLDWRWR